MSKHVFINYKWNPDAPVVIVFPQNVELATIHMIVLIVLGNNVIAGLKTMRTFSTPNTMCR